MAGERAHNFGENPGTVANYALCLSEQCEPTTVWQLLLGVDKGWEFWLLTVALITYNVVKAGLTWLVAPMRDEEEHSGYSPQWTGKHWWNGYRPLFRVHKYFVRWVFWIAVIAFALNAYDWLSLTVWIPTH